MGTELALLNVEWTDSIHNRYPTVDVDDLPRDKARFILAQQHDRVADVFLPSTRLGAPKNFA
jgi:hypothetical protein